MNTINIKGKEYVPVSERVKEFRKLHPDWTLITEVVKMDEVDIILQATIKNEEGRVIATGLAHEVAGQGMINKNSHVENCETSAWGRALGNLGIGIDASIASADEVNKAMKEPETETGDPTVLAKMVEEFEDILDKHQSILTEEEVDRYSMANWKDKPNVVNTQLAINSLKKVIKKREEEIEFQEEQSA